MSMGGAFTALGGDISTLSQNPAGIGVFRSSEMSVTPQLNYNKHHMQASMESHQITSIISISVRLEL